VTDLVASVSVLQDAKGSGDAAPKAMAEVLETLTAKVNALGQQLVLQRAAAAAQRKEQAASISALREQFAALQKVAAGAPAAAAEPAALATPGSGAAVLNLSVDPSRSESKVAGVVKAKPPLATSARPKSAAAGGASSLKRLRPGEHGAGGAGAATGAAGDGQAATAKVSRELTPAAPTSAGALMSLR
jgi:hypothetical protein